MLNFLLIVSGKFLAKIFQIFNLGSGSTWPGHIALNLNRYFIKDLLANSAIRTIFIAGTNGKTTTSSLIQSALTETGKKTIQNTAGANLLNGIASTLLLNTTILGKLDADYAVFEVDENTLPLLLKYATPDFVVLLNVFRDQLDRYGEVNTILAHWKTEFTTLPKNTMLILNADDPQIAYLAKSTQATVRYFGLHNSQFGDNKLQHAADSVYCPHCGHKLTFEAVAFSHLGNWHCQKCSFKRPLIETSSFIVYPLPGLYNKYNTLAAALVLKNLNLTDEQIQDAFTNFTPAFGRQEVIEYKNKRIQIFLSKNPTSFNQSFTTIKELRGQTLLLVLNDRVPDGRDVSWIWDVDLPDLDKFKQIFIAGDRVYDMALRIKYEGITHFKPFEELEEAVDEAVKHTEKDETLFVLPTYSAMLETRKIITGKSIL